MRRQKVIREKESKSVFMIKELKCKNFYSYQDMQIKFSDITIVSGESNGCGKTSIAQAISYALTGNLISTLNGSIQDTNVIKDGEKEMIVQLTGIMDGVPMIITRTRSIAGKKGLTIDIESSTLEGNDAELELSQIVTSEEFNQLVYINGHDIGSLIRGSPLERARLLDKMFGITAISNVIDKLKPSAYREEIGSIRYEIDSKNSQLNFIKKNMVDKLKKQSLIDEIAKNREEMQSIQNEISELEKRKAPLEVLKSQWVKYNAEILAYERDMGILDRDISNFNNIIKVKGDSLQKVVTSLTSQLESGESLPDAFLRIEARIDDCDKEYNSLLENAEFTKMIPIIRNQIIKLSKDSKVIRCPVCNGNIDLKASIYTKDDEYDEIKSKMESVLAEKSNLLKKKKMFTIFSENIEKLKSDIMNAKTERSKIEEERNKLKEKMNLITPISKFDEKDLNTIGIEIVKNNVRLEMKMKEITEKESKLLQLSMYDDDASSAIESLQSEITNLEAKLNILLKKEAILKRMRNGFDDILSKVRKKMVGLVNPKISHWISILQPYLKTEEVPFEYQLYVKNTSSGVRYDHDVFRFHNRAEYNTLSTGQQAICAIALILAVSDVSYNNLGLVIFDELHTSGIDADVTERILNSIIKLTSEIQVIFIDRRKDIIGEISRIASKDGIPIYQYIADFKKESKTSILREI